MAPKKNKKKNMQTPKKALQKKSNRTTWYAIGAIVIILIVFGVLASTGQLGNRSSNNPTTGPVAQITASPDPYANATQVLLHTSKGDITVALRNDMPITTDNFINLARQGTYDNTIFHRVIEGFMIQGGDPTGTGYGDPNIPTIQDEFTTTNHNSNGTIAMAKTGDGTGNAVPHTASSQFFINVANNDYPNFDMNYQSFGKVVSGMDVVMTISEVPVSTDEVTLDKPLQDVKLISATVLPDKLNP